MFCQTALRNWALGTTEKKVQGTTAFAVAAVGYSEASF